VEEKEEIGMKGVGLGEVNGCGHDSVKVSLVAMIIYKQRVCWRCWDSFMIMHLGNSLS